MSFKHIGTAADLVRFGASLRIECTACAAANTMSATEDRDAQIIRGKVEHRDALRLIAVLDFPPDSLHSCNPGTHPQAMLERAPHVLRVNLLKCERCGRKSALLVVLPPV